MIVVGLEISTCLNRRIGLEIKIQAKAKYLLNLKEKSILTRAYVSFWIRLQVGKLH